MDLLMNIFIALGMVDQACERLRTKHYPEETYPNLTAVCLAKQGKWQEAADILERAYSKSPNHASILNNLGNISLISGQTERAKHFYVTAAKVDPLSPVPRFNLVLTYQQCGEFEKALSSYYEYKFLSAVSLWSKILLLSIPFLVILAFLVSRWLH